MITRLAPALLIAAALLLTAFFFVNTISHTESAFTEGAPDEGRVFKLYFLGGQSNMAGFGEVATLPPELQGDIPRVYIFQGNTGGDNEPEAGDGVWAPLRSGHGAGFEATSTANQYSGYFGPELTFGARMTELEKDADIAIIKYVRGGSALQIGAAPGGTWSPDSTFGNGVNQYDHFLATVRHALNIRDIDGDGVDDKVTPAGIIWLQGEGDASHIEATAATYEPKLKNIIDLMRAVFRTDDLPVVIVQISDSGMDANDGKVMNFVDLVRDAQAKFVEKDVCASLATTDGYHFRSDRWHFDGDATLDMGRRFAEAAYELQAAPCNAR